MGMERSPRLPEEGRGPGKWCEGVGGAPHHLPEQLLYLYRQPHRRVRAVHAETLAR